MKRYGGGERERRRRSERSERIGYSGMSLCHSICP